MPLITQQSVISDDALEAPITLRKNFEGLLDTAKEFISTAKKYDDSLKSSSKTSEDHRQRTKELTDEQRVLAQITKQVSTESAKQSDAYQILSNRLRDLKQQTKEKQQIDKEDAALVTAHTSSIEKLTQALAKNRQAYAQLQNEKARTSTEGKKLLSIIQEQDKALMHLTSSGEKASGNIYLISEALSKMGEGGVRVNEILVHTGEALTSTWGVIGAAVGVAGFALKQFFERTEVGQVVFENAMTQLSVRWDQFKNKIAVGIQEIVAQEGKSRFGRPGTQNRNEQLEHTLEFLRKQRAAGATGLDDNIRALEEELGLNESILKLTEEKFKIELKEAGLVTERTTKLAKAADLEISAREAADKSAKERLDDILEANKLYNEVQLKDIELAKEKAQLQISEINLRAAGRDLLNNEALQIQKISSSVDQLTIDFDKAARRRIQLIQSLKKELQIKPDTSAFDAAVGKSILGADEQKRIQDILSKVRDENKQITLGQKIKGEADFHNELRKLLEDAQKLREEDQKKQEEQEHDLQERKLRLVETGAGSVVKIVNDQFDAQVAAHERYLGRLRENYQEELFMASGNKIAQAQLASEFREKEKREQLEIVKEKRKQAQFDRDVAVLDIGLKTAQAVMADLAKYQEAAGPFIAYDEAIGAAQLVAVLAKPLPSYDVGTSYHEGGPALVHPFELYKTPQGQIGFTPDEPSVMNLPKGTEVATADETLRMLALSALTNSFRFDRKAEVENKIVEELKEVKQAIKEQKQTNTSFYKAMAGYYAFKKESETFARKILIEKFGQ